MTAVARRTIRIDHAGAHRHAEVSTVGRWLAGVVGRTVAVGHAHKIRLADLPHTRLGRTTINVGRALADELTLVVQATLTWAAIGVKLTWRSWHTEAEFTDLVIRALRVGLAIPRRNRQAGSSDALRESARTICVRGTSVGNVTDIIGADHAWQRTASVVLTDKRGSTTTCVTLPSRGALSRRGAGQRNTVSEVAAFGHSTIGVERTVGVWLAEIAVTNRTSGALSVRGALTEINAAISKALKAVRTVCRARALHSCLTLACNWLAFLAGRAIGVTDTSANCNAEVVGAGLAHRALGIRATLAGKGATSLNAGFTHGALCVGHALVRTGFTGVIHTSKPLRAVTVNIALCDRLTGAIHTG